MFASRFYPLFFYVLFLLTLTSCATLFNTKKTGFRITTDKPVKDLSVEKNLSLENNYYVVYRSAEPLKIAFKEDSHRVEVHVQAKKSFVYWENVLNLGVGFLIDRNTVKRFSYPKTIYIEKKDSSYRVVKYPTLRKGTLEVTLTFPYINGFYIKGGRDYHSLSGFMGIGAGLNWFHADNRYFGLNAGMSWNIPVPVPAAIRYADGFKHCNIQYLSFRHHSRYGRLDFGYGLNFSHSYYYTQGKIDSNIGGAKSENIGMGLSLNVKYHTKRKLSLGVVYQPSFIGFYPSAFGYQHFITVEAAFKFRIFKPRSE